MAGLALPSLNGQQAANDDTSVLAQQQRKANAQQYGIAAPNTLSKATANVQTLGASAAAAQAPAAAPEQAASSTSSSAGLVAPQPVSKQAAATLPTSATSGLALTVPESATSAAQLTDAEKQLKSGLMTDSLSALTANQQQARSQLKQQAAQASMAPETQSALLTNLMAGQSADVLSAVQDVNNTAFGWVKERLSADQQAAQENFWKLWSSAVGTGSEQAVLDYGAAVGVDEATLKGLAENPDAWQTLADQNRKAKEEANTTSAANYLQSNFSDYGSSQERLANFQGWINQRWNADQEGLTAAASVWTPTNEQISSYEENFGAVDTNDETQKALLYAWTQYQDKLDKLDQAATAESIGADLASLGYTYDNVTLDQIQGLVGQLNSSEYDSLLRDLQSGGGGSTSPESGAASIYFTDWSGNAIASADQYRQYQNDTYQQSLNDLWTKYHELMPDTTITRDEFKDLVDSKYDAQQLADMDSNGTLTNDSTVFDVMSKNGNYADLATLINDNDFWNNNVTRLDSSKIYGTSQAAIRNRATFNAGLVPGKFVEVDGQRYYLVGRDDDPTQSAYTTKTHGTFEDGANLWLTAIDAEGKKVAVYVGHWELG